MTRSDNTTLYPLSSVICPIENRVSLSSPFLEFVSAEGAPSARMPTLGGAATEAPSESQLVQGSPLLSTDGEPTCAARAANAGGTPSDLQPSPALGPVALPVPEAQEYRAWWSSRPRQQG
jgi:hypothetical protein